MHGDYEIVFKERDRILSNEDFEVAGIEINEMDEINTLREIVMDVQEPNQIYLTTS